MKALNTSKYLLASAVATALTACGGSDYEPNEIINSNAPTHTGPLTPDRIDEISTSQTYNLDEGAVDLDGNPVFVQNLSVQLSLAGAASEERRTSVLEQLQNGLGFQVQPSRISVLPWALVDHLDSGEVLTALYSFDLSDGANSVSRTLTIEVEGIDAAPIFSDLSVMSTEIASVNQVDLLEGATDADGETLTISEFSPSANLTSDFYALNDNILTLNNDTILATLDEGEFISFTASFNVNDHNNSLNRNLIMVVAKTTSNPVAPGAVTSAEFNLMTTDDVATVDLASASYALDLNGDPIVIDWNSIEPTDGGPDLSFNKASGTILAVDPVDFSTRMDVGETATHTYSYNYIDDNAPTVGSSTFSVTVEKVAAQNLISNGSFENGLDGWTVSAAVGEGDGDPATVTVEMSADAFDGDHHAVAGGGRAALSTRLENVSPLASYYMQSVGQFGGAWNRMSVSSTNIATSELDTEYRFGQNDGFAEKILHGYSFQVPADDRDSRTISYNIGNANIDAIHVGRYSSDPGNNIVNEVGENCSDFETDSCVSSWSGVVTRVTDDRVISGTGSLMVTNTAWATGNLTLPVGRIENGKKYLLSADVKVLWDAGVNPSQLWIETADGSENPFGTDGWDGVAQSRAGNFLKIGRDQDLVTGDVVRMQHVIDTGAFNSEPTWANETMVIRFQPYFWATDNSIIIDNVQLIEIE